MAGAAERFWSELQALYKAAGRPTLDSLVRLGKQQQPPIDISTSAINAWLQGQSLPSSRNSRRYFTALVDVLQARVKQSGQATGYEPRAEGYWQGLLTAAQGERAEKRGGRPRKKRSRLEFSTTKRGPMTLPAEPIGFTGRTVVLKELLDLLDPSGSPEGGMVSVVVLAGMAGIGKSALAIHAAYQGRARGWFPGGILFTDLRGFSPAEPVTSGVVAERLLRGLGIDDADLPPTPEEKVSVWRVQLAKLAEHHQPLLVLLDNVADASQVWPLLPAEPHRALITSRQTLSALPARRIDLPVLSEQDAIALLNRALRIACSADDRVSGQQPAAKRLAELCGCLPLALFILAALLRDEPDRPLADLAHDLSDIRTRLDHLRYSDVDDQGRPLAVRAAFDLSYRRLSAEQAHAFRQLSLAPGPSFSTDIAGSLLGRSMAVARRLVSDLARAHLLDTSGNERWTMHDLILLFSIELFEANADQHQRRATIDRLLEYLRATVEDAAAHRILLASKPPTDRFADIGEALRWVDTEWDTLVGGIDLAYRSQRFAACGETADKLFSFHSLRRHLEGWLTVAEVSVAAARELGSLKAEGNALCNLANANHSRREFRSAIAAFTRAVQIFHNADNLSGQAAALNGLGAILREVREFDQAITSLQKASEMFHVIGDRRNEGIAQGNLGNTLRDVGRLDEGAAAIERDIAICREFGDLPGEAAALSNLGFVLRLQRRFDQAIPILENAKDILQDLGDRDGEALALSNLGPALRSAGRLDEARSASEQELGICREIQDQHGEGRAMSNLGAALCEMRQFEDALPLLEQASLRLRYADDPQGTASALTNLGVALKGVGRLREAIDTFKESLEIFERLGERPYQGVALSNLGLALHSELRFDEAEPALREALEAFRNSGNPHGEGVALMYLGNMLRESGRLSEAIEILERAAAIFSAAGDHALHTTVLEHLRRAQQKK